jgi:hypothetical protein
MPSVKTSESVANLRERASEIADEILRILQSDMQTHDGSGM